MTRLTNPSPPFTQVVVLGSGMAGLLAADVLAGFAERVTVLDRDLPPDTPDHRAGVPQSHHAHALLARGRTVLERRFPGLADDLRAAGATSLRGGRALRVVSPAGPLRTPPLTEEFLAFSRPLLEHQVRHRVSARPGVEFRYRHDVLGLLAAEPTGRPSITRARGRRTVVGVRARPRRGTAGARPAGEITLAADLVVDATGRRSPLPRWLAELGVGPVPEHTVSSGLGYASRLYAPPPGFSPGWHGLIINGRPPGNPRAGLILPIENGRWHVSLAGFADHLPPTDDNGFLRWARELADPALHEALRAATPLGPVRGFHTPSNRFRRYDLVRDWPRGLLAVGDSVCAFNPIYGQGMTTAAVTAEALQRALRTWRRGGERAGQRAIARAVADPWLVASGEDLRWPGVTLDGATPALTHRLRHRYLDRVMATAVLDPVVSGAYLDVIAMNRRPRHLARPRIAARVLAGRLRQPSPPTSSPALATAGGPR